MNALYNNEFFDEKNSGISTLNRAFKYGDGLFETIAVIREEPRLLAAHIERLTTGAAVLGMRVPDFLTEQVIRENCSSLMDSVGHPVFATLRIYLFREGGGLYCPDGDMANVLVTLDESPDRPIKVAQHAGFSERVVNFPGITSRLKTMSALNYVLAGQEKKEKSFDEIILKDYQGNISEALSSNIFWKKDDHYFTPSLQTGCIEGIVRNWLLEKMIHKGLKVMDIFAQEDELLTADCVFAVNAMGLQHILSIENHSFSMDKQVEQFVLEIF